MRWGLDKCGCKITVIGTDPGDIPRAKLDRCPMHKNAARVHAAASKLIGAIYEQMPDTTTSKKFQNAVYVLCKALVAKR
jgi:hypothetical protein